MFPLTLIDKEPVRQLESLVRLIKLLMKSLIISTSAFFL